MDAYYQTFAKSSQKLSRSPLGIIALFLLFIYGIAALTLGLSNLNEYSKYAFIVFLIIFPVIILFVFYNLVTKHYDKLYGPSDFRDEKYFIKMYELSLERSHRMNLYSETILQETTKAIAQNTSSENIKNEVTKAYLKNLLLPYGHFILTILYYTLEDRVKIELNHNNKTASIYVDKDKKGESNLDSFLQKFFDLHERNVLTITSLEPFKITVSDDAKNIIKELYKDFNDD